MCCQPMTTYLDLPGWISRHDKTGMEITCFKDQKKWWFPTNSYRRIHYLRKRFSPTIVGLDVDTRILA